MKERGSGLNIQRPL